MAVDLPTHQKRTELRELGLIIDQFPFNRQWDENELKSNVISEIAPVHGISDIKFMKGCYGKLTNFNLPSNARVPVNRGTT